MGEKDIITKDYLSDNRIFADAFNCYVFGGEQVITPEKLHQLDTSEIGIPYGSSDSGTPVQRFRDVLKYLSAMEDDTRIYLLLGIEAQSTDSYSMPVRNMVYDALQYAKQVEEAARSHHKSKPQKSPTPGEYLSGFYRDDRLIPVVTLVIYFSPDSWNGPRSLHEMFATEDQRILRMVPDYRINLLCPAEMSDDEIAAMKTSLREVFLYVKNSRDGERLENTVRTNSRFKTLDTRAARVIKVITGSELEIDETKEVVDMCQALVDIKSKAAIEGMAIGKAEGRAEGRAEGKAEGRAEIVMSLLKSGLLSVKMISDIAGMPVEEVERLRAGITD